MVTQLATPPQTASTPRPRMSYEAFLAWADENTHAEWVKGEVIVYMSAKPIHQKMVTFLLAILDLYVRLFNLGEVSVAPLQMRLATSGREPDILFLAKENQNRMSESYLAGPADLVIEIVSDESVYRDRQTKYREYQEAGVREYWVIDPRPGKNRADFFHLEQDNQYTLFATEDNDWVKSTVLDGFSLQPAWLWELETLTPLTCALQIEGVATALQEQINQIRKDEG